MCQCKLFAFFSESYMPGYSDSNLSGALRLTADIFTAEDSGEAFGTREDARDVVLLITDGFSTTDNNMYAKPPLL